MALQWIPQGIDIGTGPYNSMSRAGEGRIYDALATAGSSCAATTGTAFEREKLGQASIPIVNLS
jgi:hypothetical protein